VLAALPELTPARFIGEPLARNTAPAVGLAALRISLADPGAVAVFCPADHVYVDAPGYRASIETAARAAAGGDFLVTLGIRPTRPETGYGYIESGGPGPAMGALRAARFLEKPDAATATRLVGTGRHFWNAGVFVWRVSTILEAIRRHHPILHEGLETIREAATKEGSVNAPLSGPRTTEVIRQVFEAQPSISIDYAVMEKAGDVLVVPCEAGWSDVGSWDAIAELGPADASGNVLTGDVVALESRGNLVRGGGRLVALVNVSDLIVVDAGDSILICRRGESQKVREIVALLGSRGSRDLI
jgi:mannose-1-phosphate guanylyltransferase